MPTRPNPFRTLPAVELLLHHAALEPALRELPRPLVVEAVRAELANERGVTIDMTAVASLMENQRDRSRAATPNGPCAGMDWKRSTHC